MDNLDIAASQSSPSIVTDFAAGIVEMRGDSYPENAFQLFEPVFGWIKQFLRTSKDPLVLNLHLLYMNTSSVKSMMDIFDLLEDAHLANRGVAVNWFYETANERVAELAGEFKEDYAFPFEIRAITD